MTCLWRQQVTITYELLHLFLVYIKCNIQLNIYNCHSNYAITILIFTVCKELEKFNFYSQLFATDVIQTLFLSFIVQKKFVEYCSQGCVFGTMLLEFPLFSLSTYVSTCICSLYGLTTISEKELLDKYVIFLIMWF